MSGLTHGSFEISPSEKERNRERERKERKILKDLRWPFQVMEQHETKKHLHYRCCGSGRVGKGLESLLNEYSLKTSQILGKVFIFNCWESSVQQALRPPVGEVTVLLCSRGKTIYLIKVISLYRVGKVGKQEGCPNSSPTQQ